jgi:titin
MERLENRTLLATIQVTSASDRAFTADNVLTLRDAINLTNGAVTVSQLSAAQQALVTGTPGQTGVTDTIDFNIPGSGAQVILPLSQLPIVTHTVVVNGYSQPGSKPNDLAQRDDAILSVEVDGSLAGPSSYGLELSAGNSTVRGLDITRFGSAGVFLDDSGSAYGAIQGNSIGVDPTGEQAMGNGYGVGFYNSNYGLVGTNGDGINDLAERNIISGNLGEGIGISASYCVVAGNYIGTDAKGTTALGNPGAGINIQTASPIPPPTGDRVGVNAHDADRSAEGNIISGNAGVGVGIGGGGQNVVAGNFIGTDVTGTRPLGNSGTGVDIVQSNRNLIGTNGDGVGDTFERNIISANQYDGMDISQGSNNNVVAGNFVGTDVTGTQPLGNTRAGVNVSYASSFNRIGTDGLSVDNAGEANVISCNGGQIDLGSGAPGQGNLIAGNFVGADINGNPIPGFTTGSGIDVEGDSNDQIGGSPTLANTIADNAHGVAVSGASTGIAIRANRIFNNSPGLGIDLAPFGPNPNTPGGPHVGPNDLQNYPAISTAVGSAASQVIGTLNSTPNTTFILDFYANDSGKGNAGAYGQGQYYLGSASVTTDGSGNVSFNVSGLAATTPGEWISATATDPGWKHLRVFP